MICNKVVQSPFSAQVQWETDFQIFKIDWEKIHTLIYKIAYTPKIRYFLLRMVNNMTVLSYHLYKWSIKTTDLCSFYNSEIETVKHCFFYCKIVKKFWIDIQKYTKVNTFNIFHIRMVTKLYSMQSETIN